ncbi:transposase [Agromyces ramosus]|uniref:Transposase n=1 Tax=Agromyces ramosus TaxID=33879 RepID=A0A4Q7MK56_9MICO|nr:transposase [Agromyces ramosus]
MTSLALGVLHNHFRRFVSESCCVSRDVISDEAWTAVIGPLFPKVKATGRPPVDRRTVVEATAWRFRTGAPWRDLPERLGNWNTIYKNFNRWAEAGVWARVLEKVQSLAQQNGDLDWVASIDSTIVRVHQHGATLPRTTGGSVELQEVRTGAA